MVPTTASSVEPQNLLMSERVPHTQKVGNSWSS